MKVTSLTVGSIGTNCYIVYLEKTKSAVVIDPSDEAALVLARLEALGLELRAILLTHGHFDHCGDVKRLLARKEAPVWCHPADRELPSWLTHGLPAADEHSAQFQKEHSILLYQLFLNMSVRKPDNTQKIPSSQQSSHLSF